MPDGHLVLYAAVARSGYYFPVYQFLFRLIRTVRDHIVGFGFAESRLNQAFASGGVDVSKIARPPSLNDAFCCHLCLCREIDGTLLDLFALATGANLRFTRRLADLLSRGSRFIVAVLLLVCGVRRLLAAIRLVCCVLSVASKGKQCGGDDGKNDTRVHLRLDAARHRQAACQNSG
ncbi:MAG: hypothetical protein JWO13_2347 [Acidobacteriales bacterium]|nr:hypothetical protein [Terriglobales bacterium]